MYQSPGVPEHTSFDIPASGTPAWYEGELFMELDPLGTSIPTLDEPGGNPVAIVSDMVFFHLGATRTSGPETSSSVIVVDHLSLREYVGL
jgi:hypothetical protein